MCRLDGFLAIFFEAGQVGEGVLNSCPPHFRCVTNSIMSSASRRVCLNVWKRSKWWKWPTPSKPSQKTQAEAEKREPGQAWVRHVSSQKQQLFSLDLPTFRFSSPGLTFFVNSLLFHQESRRRSRREGEKKKKTPFCFFESVEHFILCQNSIRLNSWRKSPHRPPQVFFPKLKKLRILVFFFLKKRKISFISPCTCCFPCLFFWKKESIDVSGCFLCT